MSTRSTITIHDENNIPLLSVYRQSDGYFSCAGVEYQEFFRDFQVVNGYNPSQDNTKTANGAGCLAAKFLAHFKTDIGQFYVINHSEAGQQEFHYDVKLKNGKLVLTGEGHGEFKTFPLYDEILPRPVLRTVEFVYDKGDGDLKWRTLDVTMENSHYIGGIEHGEGTYKQFRKDRIVGGKIIEVK